MALAVEHLAARLERGLAPLYTIVDAEPLLALEAADALRAAARAAGYSERQVLTVEQHFDWSQLDQAAASLSLFGSRRVLELRVPGGRPGKEGGLAIERYCAALPPDTVTLVLLPKLERDMRESAWFAALAAAGPVLEAAPVPRETLPQWIGTRLAAQGHKAAHETLQFIADLVEGNLLAAHQEIRKLGLLYPPGELSFEQVRRAVLDVARYDVYALGEAMATGDGARYARVLAVLRGEGTALPLLLWALARDIRAIARVRRALDAGQAIGRALSEARVWRDSQRSIGAAARRLSLAALEQALWDCAQIDRMIKGLAADDPWEAVLRLGLALAAPAPAGGRRPALAARAARG